MKALLIQLPWPPSVNHYYRRVGHRTIISREGRAYRKEVCTILRSLHIRTLEGDLQLVIDAYPPDKRRRDLDNILKSMFDSMQHGGAYKDDSQIKDFECHMCEPHRPNGKVIVRLNEK